MKKKAYDKKILNTEKRSVMKLIQTDAFKIHMKAHENDFCIPYPKLISYIEENKYLDKCSEEIVEKVIEFPLEIGYTHVNEISDKDFIVYAKRRYRNIYSKFTLNSAKRATNKCVLILKKDKYEDNQYIIITMFPGEYAMREVQDKNIKTEEERKRVVDFWNRHAFAYDVNMVDTDTITDKCPY